MKWNNKKLPDNFGEIQQSQDVVDWGKKFESMKRVK